ncbi:hypothetical protein T05_3946 [Trichinella murrelli]|uniref:Uncharacterized protein n=1 Tax=Trichinella murrelli TaxID=144512 RepID=A0A0V0UE99_9BILA|nr:hypothetical protein T05_3946 [Trichinella murrelli]
MRLYISIGTGTVDKLFDKILDNVLGSSRFHQLFSRPTGSAKLIIISFGSCPSMRLVLAPVDALLPAHHDVGITADN